MQKLNQRGTTLPFDAKTAHQSHTTDSCMSPEHKKYPSENPFEAVNPRFLVILLILIVSAVYINAAFGKFVWDDQTIVVRNEAIKSFKNIPFIFTHDFAKMANYGGNIYRPMQELTYMADFFLWRMNPAGFHVTNILFQIGCALFLFYIVMAINGSKSVAFFFRAHFWDTSHKYGGRNLYLREKRPALPPYGHLCFYP